MSKTNVGFIPSARAKPASPLQTLSTKRNWDRMQIKGSTMQLLHQVTSLPLDPKTKGKMVKNLKEQELILLTTVDQQWRRAKATYRATVNAEFLDYPPKGEKK